MNVLIAVIIAQAYLAMAGLTRELLGEAPDPAPADVIGPVLWYWVASIFWPCVYPFWGGGLLVQHARRLRIPRAVVRRSA